MRSLYIVLALVLAPLAALIAQPTLTIGNGSACTGESFCVPVNVRDFTNINSLRFSIRYDATVLTFTGAQNFNAAMQIPNGNLGPALFSEGTPGEISFNIWETGNCTNPSNIGVTLDDGSKMYDLCFTAIGSYGEQSAIAFDNTPTAIRCTRNATLCNNIGIIPQNGEATLCVREFNLTASDVSGNEGDQVCVDFTVSGFDGLNGIQFTTNYDPAALRFISLFPNTEIPSNTLSAYGLPGSGSVAPGDITVAWVFSTQPNLPPTITIPDGTTMFTACFEIIAPCETTTSVSFSGDPTPIEVNNGDPANPSQSSVVPVSLNTGTVSVNTCTPTGIQIVINCGDPADLGDLVCVEFEAGANFNLVSRLEYLMTWNPNILEFVSVDDPNALGSLTATNFNSSNAANGVLGLEWSLGPVSPLETEAPGNLLYRVCFRVVGVGGDSPVQISVPGIGVSNNVNIGINPTNCVVEVNQPQSVVVSFGDIEADLGASACMPVTVSNFNDVEALDFTLAWDETAWLYNGQITNINPLLTGAGTEDFTPIGASSLGFVWANGTGVTLPNNTVLFEVCFETAPTAVPGACDDLYTVGFPFAERAVTGTSNGQNIGLITDTASLCVLFPEGFGLTAIATAGDWLDTVCMEFTVESFDNITGADFSINWDPAQLTYVSSQALAWTNLVLALPQPVGTIEGSYLAPNPEPLPDGAVAFEVCFQLVGDPNDCYPVTIQTNATPEALTTNGLGSIVQTNAEICIEDRIVIESMTITQPSCPGACDGRVEITIREWSGQGFIGTTWQTEPFAQFTPLLLEDVCEGNLIFTIFDNNSGVTLTDTITLVSDGVLPTAVINGDDVRELGCDPAQILVTTNDQGPGFSYAWYYNTVSSTQAGDGRQIFATQPGNLILCVLNSTTGCTAYDTIMVILPELPIAEAVPTTEGVTCTTDCVTINAANVDPALRYRWEILNGNPALVDSATINTPNFTVCGPGRFRLIVTDPITGCSNDEADPNDEVTVADNRIFPSACVNSGTDVDREQNCDGTPLVFDASCSSNAGLDVTYTWYPVNADGTLGAAAGSGLTIGFTELGMYAVLVQETTSGCTDTAFASIIPNTNAPAVAVAEPSAIDCNTNSSMLTATLTPNDPTYTFVWVMTDGGTLAPGTENSLTPTALTPGTYQIVVTNPANQCEAEATVIVTETRQSPEALISNAPETLVLTCANQGTLVLDGRDSEDGMNYQWYLGDLNTPIAGATTDTLVADVEGLYILQVTNPTTGCSGETGATVTSENETPTVVLDQLEATLTCVETTATVTATILNAADFIVDAWVGDSPEATASIVSVSPNGLELTVNGPGVYTLRVESTTSGCVGEADFIVTQSIELPNARVASDTLTINCANGEVMLSGAGSSMGQNFTYLWENLDGTGGIADPTAIQTTTNVPATYRLTVSNLDNGCTADTLVRVGGDLLAPTLNLPAVENISCTDLTRMLSVEVTGATNFTVEWSGTPTPMPSDAPNPTVSAPGTYTVEVTNTDNGCQATGMVTVGSDADIPTISIVTPAEFDCPTEFVVLDASATGNPGDFSLIEWQFGGGVVGNGTFLLNAASPGEYTLNVVSAANGCPATQTVTVAIAANLTLPTIALNGAVANLDCDGQAVTIDASATGLAADFASIEWSGTADFTEEANPFVITTTSLGSYTLTVTANSPLAGCTSSETFDVVLDPNLTLPTIALNGTVGDFGCDRTPVVIDASATGDAADFASILWESTSPFVQQANPLIISAQDVGTYTLTVSFNDEIAACAVSETFTVMPDVNTPVANAGADVALDCGATAALDATASTPPSATFVYTWETVSGATLTTGVDGPTPAVTAAGTYRLIVTNVDNGCADTSAVVAVTLVFPADADAGELVTTCGETAELNAVAVAGTTGVWTTTTTALIEMNTDPASGVSNLPVGTSTFTWTLSAPGCPDYSSDEVTVVRATGITANPDQLNIATDAGMGMVNVLANDILSGQTDLEVTVLTAPTFGTYDSLAFAQGNLVLTVGPLDFGTTTMTYQICSRICPDLCATATVTINVQPGDDSFVPNTITPNGDGANDELIFDVLLYNPAEEFPDNELIIFNRWGNIIFEAKPYNNNWAGLGQNDQPVPEGTYYYILRLNISEGEILRGDITVIR